ncbi:hypothetical protein F183_A00640 [Bryobacterales bacterium F-183]|nr:hypothetical protein F183_A00640 [Bryobacterales bacterium F-183]
MISLLLLFALAVDPQKTIALEGETYHVQGIVVADQRLYVTSVDRPSRRGFLFEFELPSGKRLRSIEIQDGDRYHPGGFDADADSFWIPVAEYKKLSSAVIQKRNRKTLALEASFTVDDHIGCVAVAKDKLYGGNWDARQIYEWSKPAGKLLQKRDNPSSIHYQDCKFRDGKLLGAGTDGATGAVEILDPATLKLIRRVEYGKTPDRKQTLYTHEGMDVYKGKLYLLPEDAPSRLFVFAPAP